jgi:phage tail sheath protein FI
MPATQVYKTPGVYVAEIPAFPPSVVGVATAIPVFVGYTERATVGGKPVIGKPISISSLAAYEEVFGTGFSAVFNLKDVTPTDAPGAQMLDAPPHGPDDYDFTALDTSVSPPVTRYYELTASGGEVQPAPGDEPIGFESDTEPSFMLEEDPAPDQPRFNLYNSMRLFYDNGGGDCYVVSAGTYKDTAGTVVSVAAQPLIDGLAAASQQVGPTMIVVPDAVLLPPDSTDEPWTSADFAKVAQAMLKQASTLQDRIAILDVYGSQYANTSDGTDLPTVIEGFREDVGEDGLSYGAAYFPFLDTTVIPLSDVTYRNIDNTDEHLQNILRWQNQTLNGGTPRYEAVNGYIDQIPDDTLTEAEVTRLNQNLLAALPILKTMELQVIAKTDVLPPSGAMAGVYTRVDSASGVWNAPANVTLASVAKPTMKLNNKDQEDLNVPVNGKAVDALRAFPGRGTVVWGARTLDGNSPDFRYVQVRRTLIYLEQSIKAALEPFVFAANTGQTWATVVSMVSGFLTGVWSRGGLMGATPKDAFSVTCGVGSTMTGTDVLDGYMIVQVTVSLIRPAEFIELTFKQTMQGVG